MRPTHTCSRVLLPALFVLAVPGAGTQAQFDPVCEFRWSNTCFATLEAAEEAMRSTSSNHELLEVKEVDEDRIRYHVPPLPPLPEVTWRGEHYTDVTHPNFGPAFATLDEALQFTIDKARLPSERYPDRIASDNLIFRGETNYDDLRQRYYSHDYPAVPITSINLDPNDPNNTTAFHTFCPNYAIGVPEGRINAFFHFGYGGDDAAPWNLQPNIVSFAFNNCPQGDDEPFYRIWGFHVFHVSQFRNIRCNSPYTFDGANCVIDLEEEIEIGPFFVLEEPPQFCPLPGKSNPCDTKTGNKYQVESDYSTTADGGLSFTRYYNSKGPYKSASGMGVGWRHSYSRSLDERPDKNRLPIFPAPANRSRSYPTPDDACIFGWEDLRNTVWGGDLAGATASFAGGNLCEISLAGNTVAYFPIRDAKATGSLTPPAQIRTITRPNGAVFQFQLSGTEWLNLLNPALRLEQSGGNWIFTDTNDTRETYDALGRLLSIRRRNGQTETLEYDLTLAEGGDDDPDTLDRVTGPFGHALTLIHDENGRLESVITPDGAIRYTHDGHDNLTAVDYPDLSTRRYLFEKANLPNLITGLIDENGDRFATWDYDDAGRAILSEHAGGAERVELVYNPDGTTTVNMADGSSRTYDFSTQQGQRKVSAITGDACANCADSGVKDRSYDVNGFSATTVDWNGNITNTIRDERGLTTTRTEAVGTSIERTTTMEWHTEFRLPTKITAPRNVTDLVYDTTGNLLTRTITGGTDTRAWTVTYNSFGQPLTTDGPRTDVADVTTMAYYDCTSGIECGQLRSVTNALGHVTTFDLYDDSGRLLSMIDPNGLQTRFTYDARGRITTTEQIPVNGVPRATKTVYDDAGQVETLTMPDGQVLTHTYDAAHYLRSITDNFGNRIEYDYDSMGNQISEERFDPTNVLKRSIAQTYDLNNRIDTVTNGGFVTDLDFDDMGNLVSETDPRFARTQHNYDALNRLDDTIDALNGFIDYEYDDHDNLASVTAANGVQTVYEYDGLDNLTSEISPDRGTLVYTYDDAGNRVTELDARGKLTINSYDALNRLELVTFNDGKTISYTYDSGANAVGRLDNITDSSGQTLWSYDNFGAVTQKQQIIGAVALTTEYSYDDNGRMATMTLPSGKVVTYGYNIFQQNSVSVDGQPVLSAATYEPFGPVNGWSWGDGSIHSRSYNLRGLMTSHSIASDTRMLGYDASGNVTSQTDSRQSNLYEYDLLGRLISATPAGESQSGPVFSSPPVLLTSIQTMRNEIGAVPGEPSMPWLTVATRRVTAEGAQISLERSQVNTGTIEQRERIGYLAVEAGASGSFTDSGGNTITYESQISPPTIEGWANGCFEESFLNGYASSPLVLASLNTHNGGDGGWLRRCSLTQSALGLTVDEDRYTDRERRHHNAESAGIVAFSSAFDAQFNDDDGSWGMEAAEVTLPRTTATSGFTRVSFRQTYATRPIVIVLPSSEGNQPASLRIRRVTRNGFDVAQVEPAPENGVHRQMTIHYLAIERGAHTLPDGTKLEAGQKGTRKQQHGSGVVGNEGWVNISFSINEAPLPDQVFTYDANGNRTSLTENGVVFPYTIEPGSNRLLSTSGPEARNFTYDDAGNITGDGAQTFEYDDRGRLTSVDSGLATYQHNGQGQRVIKNAESQTLFVYDDNGLLSGQYDALGTPIQENVFFQGAPVALSASNSLHNVHTDHLGTPRAITDNGVEIWSWGSDPFGQAKPQEDPDGDTSTINYNLRYFGQYFDVETGFHYNYFRDYKPAIGQYLQSDPIGLTGGRNTYSYVSGNPIRFVDPYGLFCIPWFSETTPWKVSRRGRPMYTLTGVVFTGVGGVMGTCLWVKSTPLQETRDTRSKRICFECDMNSCGRKECEWNTHVGEWIPERRDTSEDVRVKAPAIRFYSGNDIESGDIWACNNPWTGQVVYGPM
ncbi:MAG: RHS repeat-associated core domain-containing protein [Woeseiaceae bacterium]|nr:RHS repeat-associated core domain-containing protein [Woeseiaceae bacterium]